MVPPCCKSARHITCRARRVVSWRVCEPRRLDREGGWAEYKKSGRSRRRAALFHGRRSRLSKGLRRESLHTLGRDGVAAGDRLGDVAGELQDRLAEAGALGDRAVESGAGIVALQLEEVGRRLHFSEVLEGGRSFLESLAAIFGGFLAQSFDALGGDLRGSDDGLDIPTGQLGELFGNLGRTLGGHFGALVDVAENALELVGGEQAGV